MRIAAISDIHGNLGALEAVLADIERRGVDLIVNLGDILSGPLQPRETADRLMALDLPTIRGNHERQLLASDIASMGASDRYAAETMTAPQRRWLEALPATRWVTDDIFLCHATPQSDIACYLEDIRDGELIPAARVDIEQRTRPCDATLILCGHTHIPRVCHLEVAQQSGHVGHRSCQLTGQLIVNPGSVGIQAYNGHHPILHHVEIGAPHARYALLEQAPAGTASPANAWIADLIAVPYDWEAAARLAEAHGRPEWSTPLRTGFL